MLERASDRIHGLLIATMIGAGIWTLRHLPPGALVPIHFDLSGRADDWARPEMGLFLLPATAAALWGLRACLPKIDPRGDNLRRSDSAVRTIWLVLALLLALLQGGIVCASLGLPWEVPGFGLWLTGALLIGLGNVMGKLRPNFTVGIRTPWTLSHERVWDQTHRFGGKTMVLSGAVLWGLAALPLNPAWQVPAIIILVLFSSALPVLKSYLLWRELQAQGH